MEVTRVSRELWANSVVKLNISSLDCSLKRLLMHMYILIILVIDFTERWTVLDLNCSALAIAKVTSHLKCSVLDGRIVNGLLILVPEHRI